MGSSEVFGDNMVNCEERGGFPAVLAGKMVASEDLAPGECDFGARRVDHPRKADDRRDGEGGVGSSDHAATIEDQ